MADMWKNRAPPTPLDFESVMTTPMVSSAAPAVNGDAGNGHGTSNGSGSGTANGGGLKDQRMLSLKEMVETFVDRFVFLSSLLHTNLTFTFTARTALHPAFPQVQNPQYPSIKTTATPSISSVPLRT